MSLTEMTIAVGLDVKQKVKQPKTVAIKRKSMSIDIHLCVTGPLGCVHIEIYGIRYMVFAIRYSVFALRYTDTAVHIEVAHAFSVLFS